MTTLLNSLQTAVQLVGAYTAQHPLDAGPALALATAACYTAAALLIARIVMQGGPR